MSILLWRNGPLGYFNLMYTPTAMVVAQAVIAALGASRWQLYWLLTREARLSILAAVIAGFGAVVSEVGASMMVGGNAVSDTRVLTTATVLAVSRGDFDVGIALSLILMLLAYGVTLALLLPAEITYRFDGCRVDVAREGLHLRRQMAVIFQEPLLLSGRVLDNVAPGLRLRRQPPAVARAEARKWLARLGVAHLAQRNARSLSGGEAQRVNLARALALGCCSWMSPWPALDAITRAALLRDLGPILKGAGMTALFVTHDFREIPPLAVIIDGRVVQTGAPAAVFAAPVSPALAELLRAGADLAAP